MRRLFESLLVLVRNAEIWPPISKGSSRYFLLEIMACGRRIAIPQKENYTTFKLQ
jgi:hypothetical protein